jgi:hypothetical protein
MAAGINLAVGWIAVLVGLMAGAGIGLFFHDDAWLGGYSSWSRRMVRLGHISLLGTGLLNVAFALTLQRDISIAPLPVASALLAVSVLAMPAVCFLAAWRKPFRHAFAIPVSCLIVAVGELVIKGGLF